MTTLEKFEMPHIATIDVEGRRYNVALRIEHDGVEFVGRLWFADEAWADDDGIVDQGVLPGRSPELVINNAQSLGERELVQRYRRALAQKRRFHALRRLTVEVLENIRHLNALATSMRGNRVVVNTLPATMTSARRKWTRLSPSVIAFGTQNISTASPFWNVRRRSSR